MSKCLEIEPGARGGRSAPIPIIPHAHMAVSRSERARLAAIATRLLRDEPALGRTDVFGDDVLAGTLDGPMLVLGDHHSISLLSQEAGTFYQYRMSLLAREGDLVAFDGVRHPSFEQYLRDTLGLGGMLPVTVDPVPFLGATSLSRRCMTDKRAFEQIVSVARQNGCLTLLPHISSGDVWVLAGAIAAAAGCPVRVAASPPRLSRRVNHKLWFSALVNSVLGRQAQPIVHRAYGPAALAGKVASLAGKHERLVVKVPDSAGSAGNHSLWSRDICELNAHALRTHLLTTLRGLGWVDSYPLLIQVWEQSVLSTPSAQLWVPHVSDGLPVLEGIFEQVVEGPVGEFVGSVPAELPSHIKQQFAGEATRLAMVLQACGYFGRCSFDAVVIGETLSAGKIHWIECNGRWGGVSIPMTLVNRLTGNWAMAPFVVVQKGVRLKREMSVNDVITELGNRLFLPGQKRGLILLSPFGMKTDCRAHLAAIGTCVEDAKACAQDGLDALTA